jgi:hypothetical protein
MTARDWADIAVKEGLVAPKNLGRITVLFGSAMLNGSLQDPFGKDHRKKSMRKKNKGK